MSVAKQVRDLAVWGDLVRGPVYVAACDVNAAIGSRPGDSLAAEPEDAGYNVAKVALMEVLAAGADPFVVFNSLCGPLDDYGERVVEGIRTALADVAKDVLVLGSDETNATTVQTGVGLTIIGSATPERLLLGRSQPEALVACIGVPKDGIAVRYREGSPEIASPSDVLRIRDAGLCQELLPVGSKGVRYEMQQLAELAGLDAHPADEPPVDLNVSAGASTCFLATVGEPRLAELRASTTLPVHVVGSLVDRRTPTGRKP